MAEPHASDAWDHEYLSPGIPSSFAEEPSISLRWGLSNISYLGAAREEGRALDLGCGNGRNTRMLAERGFQAFGVDFSAEALRIAGRENDETIPHETAPAFVRAEISGGLPFARDTFAFATDNFVYFHQTKSWARAEYRASVHRVLSPDGLLLVELATDEDGYYAGCPPLTGRSADDGPAVIDPIAGIANLLFPEERFIDEMSDLFRLEIAWRHRRPGEMYGKEYERRSVATLWRPA